MWGLRQQTFSLKEKMLLTLAIEIAKKKQNKKKTNRLLTKTKQKLKDQHFYLNGHNSGKLSTNSTTLRSTAPRYCYSVAFN